jgi:glycosyltransferase involved in cell wall biosynthesis
MEHKISIVIPTYNCAAVLAECLESIKMQNYPRELIELIIVDGLSQDNTVNVARQYNAKILINPDSIHPLGRPLGIAASTGDLILCLDSDNIFPDENFLQQMAEPFVDPDIIAAEPLYYLARKNDNLVTKYCALIGGDDPLIPYLGLNDRYSYLTNHWTKVPVDEKFEENYIKVKFLHPDKIPSLGANGFLVRKDALLLTNYNPFYHVNVAHQLIANGHATWAKIKNGIIHKHGESIKKFILKKKRRSERRLNKIDMGYTYPIDKYTLGWILFRGLLILPILYDSIRSYLRKPSYIWILHPIFFYAVITIYANNYLLRYFKKANNYDYEKV